MSDGIAVGEERACRGERKLSSRGREVFVGTKRGEVEGEERACREEERESCEGGGSL